MKIAVHQPNYLPYLGFFDKMDKADIFVIYDDAQFTKEDFHHRNKIRISNGWKWLTVPVYKQKFPISKIRIRNELLTKGQKWNTTHLAMLMENYKRSPKLSSYESEIESIYTSEYEYLLDLNMALINFLMKSFGISTKIVFSSEFDLKTKSTEKLVDMVESLDGDVYLSGIGGKDYLDISLFNRKDILVEYQEFRHPVYNQCYERFEPNMSSIDALFNVGDTVLKGGL